MQTINLLPKELRKDPTIELKRVIKTALLTTFLGILFFTVVTLLFNNYFLQKEIESVRYEIAALEPKVEKVENLKAEALVNKRKLTTYKNILSKVFPWPELLTDIAFNTPRDIWLTEVQTAKVESPIKTDNKESKATDQEVQESQSETYVVIRGCAPNLSTIGVFMLHMNKLSALENVTLIVAKKNPTPTVPIYFLDFEIKAKVKTSMEGGSI